MNHLDDIQIIEAIKAGKNDFVLEQLYKEVLPKIKRLILKNSGSEDDAKDIFQDTVLILYNQIRQNKFDATKEVSGFMYTVARNLWINKVKKANRFDPLIDTETVQESASDPLKFMIDAEKSNVIETLMNQLGGECKQLLQCSLYERMSMKEIADKMGYSSEGVAKTYNYRCKQKLINLIKENPYIIALFKE